FFFFQAEDGIRDYKVTGVQTCALPISYLIAPYDPDTTSPKPTLRGATQVPWDKDVASLAMMLLMNVPIGRPDSASQNWLGGPVEIGRASCRERVEGGGGGG